MWFLLVVYTSMPFNAIWASSEARSAVKSIFRQAVDKFGLLKCLTKCKTSNTIQQVNQPQEESADNRRRDTVVEACRNEDEMIETSVRKKKIRPNIKEQRSNAASGFRINKSGISVSNGANQISNDLPLSASDVPIAERSFPSSKTSNTLSLPLPGSMDVSDYEVNNDEGCSRNTNQFASSLKETNDATQILSLNELINSYGNVLSRHSYPKRISTGTLNQNILSVDLPTSVTQKAYRKSRGTNHVPFRSKIPSTYSCCFTKEPNATDAVENMSINIVSRQNSQCFNDDIPNSCELEYILDSYNAHEMNKMDIDDPIVRCPDFKRNELSEEEYSGEILARFHLYGMSPESVNNPNFSG